MRTKVHVEPFILPVSKRVAGQRVLLLGEGLQEARIKLPLRLGAIVTTHDCPGFPTFREWNSIVDPMRKAEALSFEYYHSRRPSWIRETLREAETSAERQADRRAALARR